LYFNQFNVGIYNAETCDLLTRIRNSPPARRVRGRAGNVSGFFPSRKMGVAIQFESSIELGAIYLMEQDESVLEYYDQPVRRVGAYCIPVGNGRS
jgi:hypothetical protein